MGRVARSPAAMAAAAALASAAFTAGCYFATSFEGLSNGGDTTAGDGGPTNGEGGPAGGEGGPAGGEGGPGPTGDGSAGFNPTDFCAKTGDSVLRCDDFERPAADLRGDWDDAPAGPPASAAIEQGTTPAGGSELVIRMPSINAGIKFVGAEVLAGYDKTVSHIVETFAFDIVQAPDTNTAQIMDILIAYGNDHYSALYFQIHSDGMTLTEQSFKPDGDSDGFDEEPLAPSPSLGAWHVAVLDTRLGSPAHTKVTVDGVVVYDRDHTISLGPGVPTFTVGLHYADGPGGPLEVHFDDFTVGVE